MGKNNSVYSYLVVVAVTISLLIQGSAQGESATDEILNIAVKLNDQPKSLPLKITGAEPLFVKVEQNDANGFVEISVYLATSVNKQFTVTSDLNDFIASSDGAKTLIQGKDRAVFAAQSDRVQVFVYGQVPKKTLFNILKVVGEQSDLLNVLGRSTPVSESNDAVQGSQVQSKQARATNPLDNPVLKKLNAVISNSTLPNKDHYVLVMHDVEKTFKEGSQEQAISQALAAIDEIMEKENLFSQNKRECERSRLMILQVEDLISKTDAPQKATDDAKRELNHAKAYQDSFLCDEAFVSAKKAEEAIQLDPLEFIGMEYPWLLPGGVIVAICFAAFVIVQKYRSEGGGVKLK